jgi:erythritol transport system ATP-binding protein
MKSDDPSIILRVEGVTKTFPGTVALDGVDFAVRRGAVSVLIGENGAGKSTLMKILAGVEQPTAGRLLLDGAEVHFSSIRDAAQHGIGIVFQELNLCPNLTVAENIFLGRDLTRVRIDIDQSAQRARTRELFKRLEHDIDPDTRVGELMIGEQQIVEIAKALVEDVRILIMDEPTSALSATEVEVLFRVIDELRRSGVAVIYISHRLEELVRIGDYFTVLRDGRVQATATRETITVPWIIRQMLGTEDIIARRPPKVAAGPAVLDVADLCLPRMTGRMAVDHVNLSFRSGEVTAIYGLLGAGRTELFESLFGLRSGASGSVRLKGVELAGRSVTRRIKAGLLLVPEDRQRDGLVPNLSVGGNLGLASLRRFTRYFWLSSKSEQSLLSEIIAALRIKTPGADAPITALSGGNQQKVVIGKTLLTQPSVLLLDEPSRGIDVGAKAEVFSTMRDLADQGLTVVFSTSDLKETHAVADRVVVMAHGRVTADLRGDAATDEALVLASTQYDPHSVAA